MQLPSSPTPLPPLYLDWSQHAECGNGIAYFLQPANTNNSPTVLWPGETAEEVAESSFPAEYWMDLGHVRWYPATRDGLWWARIQWENQHN